MENTFAFCPHVSIKMLDLAHLRAMADFPHPCVNVGVEMTEWALVAPCDNDPCTCTVATESCGSCVGVFARHTDGSMFCAHIANTFDAKDLPGVLASGGPIERAWLIGANMVSVGNVMSDMVTAALGGVDVVDLRRTDFDGRGAAGTLTRAGFVDYAAHTTVDTDWLVRMVKGKLDGYFGLTEVGRSADFFDRTPEQRCRHLGRVSAERFAALPRSTLSPIRMQIDIPQLITPIPIYQLPVYESVSEWASPYGEFAPEWTSPSSDENQRKLKEARDRTERKLSRRRR
jgi:hypothetical protein